MNKKIKTILLAVLLVAAGAGVGAYAASVYGTQADPLVAKSYLDGTLTPKLQSEFQAKIDKQSQILENQIAESNTTMNFTAVNLSSGQTLQCDAGCELVLSSGDAVASGTFSDVTAGSSLAASGTLTANHLCVAAGSTGVSSEKGASLLVRGHYTLG